VVCSECLLAADSLPAPPARWLACTLAHRWALHGLRRVLSGGVSKYAATSRFTEPCPATTFTSPAHSHLFFRSDECLRADQSTCLGPADKFYEVRAAGAARLQRLGWAQGRPAGGGAACSPAAVQRSRSCCPTNGSPRCSRCAQVTHSGLNAKWSCARSPRRGCWSTTQWVLLPPECDVESHVRAVMRKYGAGGAGGGGGAEGRLKVD
jgi:hypothetical protein